MGQRSKRLLSFDVEGAVINAADAAVTPAQDGAPDEALEGIASPVERAAKRAAINASSQEVRGRLLSDCCSHQRELSGGEREIAL